MSEVLTQADCEREIIRLARVMESKTVELASLARNAANAEAIYKREWAKQYLIATGPIVQRQAQADVDTYTEFLDRKITEGVYDACKEALRSLRTSIDALRTISANIRGQT